MKTILIEEVANGWIVRDRDVCSISFRPGDVRVYRSVHELAAELPKLLESEPHAPAPTPEEIRQARKREIDEKFPPPPKDSPPALPGDKNY